MHAAACRCPCLPARLHAIQSMQRPRGLTRGRIGRQWCALLRYEERRRRELEQEDEDYKRRTSRAHKARERARQRHPQGPSVRPSVRPTVRSSHRPSVRQIKRALSFTRKQPKYSQRASNSRGGSSSSSYPGGATLSASGVLSSPRCSCGAAAAASGVSSSGVCSSPRVATKALAASLSTSASYTESPKVGARACDLHAWAHGHAYAHAHARRRTWHAGARTPPVDQTHALHACMQCGSRELIGVLGTPPVDQTKLLVG